MTTWRYVPLAVGAAVAVRAAMIWSRIRRDARPRPLDRADAIVVFGAAVWATGPSLTLRVRVAKAAELYKNGWADRIVCSGGLSDGVSEASVMRGMLIADGIPPAAVIPDDGGVSTSAAVFTTRMFARQHGWRRVIAVSSTYHMHRILCEARRQGLDVIPGPAPRPGPTTPRLLLYDRRQELRETAKVLLDRPRVYRWRLSRARWFGKDIADRLRSLLWQADELRNASESLGEEIKRQAGLSDGVTVTTPAAARFVWPVNGRVSSVFGIRHHRLHAGIDIAPGYGACIRAAASGRVVMARRFGPYGNLCAIDHGGGLSTVYAHQAGLVVEDGQEVTPGQLLGYVGTTGGAYGPHLHFEVRVHGEPVDPLVYLNAPAPAPQVRASA